MQCVFCDIVHGRIPHYQVWEDNAVLAFLDIHPCVKGHTIVIPKAHIERLLDANTDQLCQVMSGVWESMRVIEKKLSPAGFTVGWNDGREAGQAVPHLHAHILPRFGGDGGGSMHSVVNAPAETSVAELARLLSQ